MDEQAVVGSGMEKEEFKSLLTNCYESTAVTARALFPSRFHRPFCQLHEKIFRILDDDSIKQAVIAAPRGWGKTSLINLAYPAKRILFRDKRFIVPISNTATQAVMQSENLKRELLTNSRVKRLFGDVRLSEVAPGSFEKELWTKDMWIAHGGTFILPRGSGQQVRGILYGDHRPDLIIGDDLEDPEAVRSEEQREKMKEWFFADVCNAIDRAKKDWRIIVLGTILHEDSLLSNLLEDPDWYSVELSICDDNYRSNWPEYMTDEEVLALKNSYQRKGMLDTFYREYRNIPVSKEDATFKPEYVKYYIEGEEDMKDVESFILVDPAKTVKIHSAETAIIGVGIDLFRKRIYVRDVVAKKLHPDQIYSEAFAMADRLGSRVIGIEVTSLNEFITYPIKNEMLRRGKFYELVELNARGKKEDRARALVPFYRMGYMHHNQACCGPLEAQLFSFPRPRRWDCIDALAYMVPMLDEGDRYFFGEGTVPEESFEEGRSPDPEDEYDELELDNEPEMDDGWMIA